MRNETITIYKVEPPADGKKNGKIIDSTGKKYDYWNDKVVPPPVGSTVRVDIQDREGQGQWAGRTFSTIKAIYTGTNPGPVQRPAPASTPQAPPPSPRQDNTDERIFVCGIVNNAVRAGKCDPEAASSIIAVVEAARSAWRMTFGA